MTIESSDQPAALQEQDGLAGLSSSAAPAPVIPPPDSPVAALPEAAMPEPPRALVPGAFLRLEFEIKQVISRGLTNLYLAQAGDYGQAMPKLIAEREAPAASAAPVTAGAASNDAPPVSEPEPAGVVDSDAEAPYAATEEDELREGALEAEAYAELSRAAVVGADLDAEHAWAPTPAPTAATESSLQSALLPDGEHFTQDEREYVAFDYEPCTALQDYLEPTNDVRYLEVLTTLAEGLLELQDKHLGAFLTRDLLRLDAAGAVRYYGFVDAVPTRAENVDESAVVAPDASPPPLEQLREINSFLLKRVFAESATMRLGDEFGSLTLSDEVKVIAQRLHEHEYADLDGVLAALRALHPPPGALRVQAALLSDVGQERELNEDAGMIFTQHRAAHLGSYQLDVYVVADGMGGHEGGEVASNLTLVSLQRNLWQRVGINWNDNIAVKQALLEIIDAVNAEVVALTETPQYRAMRAKPGSTLVFAVRLGPRVFIGNVGDSRAYKYDAAHGLQRITRDHSYVQTLLDRGEITEEEAWDHPEGSIITANIGDPKLRLRDVYVRYFAPGDMLLLVSDGVVDMLRDRDIVTYLAESDAQTVCQNLVAASNAAGGGDNITAVCVTFTATETVRHGDTAGNLRIENRR